MTWLNAVELEKKYSDPKFQERFADLYALRLFLKRCLVSTDYKPPERLGDAVALTEIGQEWIPLIMNGINNITETEARVALFVAFAHQELFVDLHKTNSELIKDILDSEISSGRIRYPWVYDRFLYDRFFAMFHSQTYELSYDETRALLENTPQGVFQIREFVVGPFGVLSSLSHRYLPPLLSPLLWHCSDPSCGQEHEVELSSGKSKVSQAAIFVSAEGEKAEGQRSEWFKFFSYIESEDWYDDTNLWSFPFLLADGFGEKEHRNILKELITQHSKEIRERFPKMERFRDILSGSAQNIVERLNKAQCFQLILLMPAEAIVCCLESLIEDQIIKIPVSETRTTRHAYVSHCFFDIRYECSQLGVRSVCFQDDISLARLKRLINHIYREREDRDNLWWKLRYVSGESNYEKLDTYVHTEDPKQIIRDLVLSSPDNLQEAFRLLRYGRFTVPHSPEDEDYIIDKILWKLGFNVDSFPPHEHLFWEWNDKFLSTARDCRSYDERDRELIRSAGVNFFVSLEEILDRSLSFTTWMLLSDHYSVTKFKCNLDDARRFMSSRLNGLQLGSGEPLEFDPDGKNTLWVLIQGFAVLAGLCRDILKSTGSEFRRQEAELPGYHGQTEIELFPFLHKVLVLDLGERDYLILVNLLQEISTVLESSQVCSIRNRIDHWRKRSDFPAREEIETACRTVAETVQKMEDLGICPLIYLHRGATFDEYGRSYRVLQNYRGRKIRIIEPSQYRLCPLPSFERPQIVVPGVHIADSSQYLRFQFEEPSEYVTMWQDYPKRKTRVTP